MKENRLTYVTPEEFRAKMGDQASYSAADVTAAYAPSTAQQKYDQQKAAEEGRWRGGVLSRGHPILDI